MFRRREPQKRGVEHRAPDAATQLLLRMNHQRLAREGGPLPSFREVGFTVCSQSDEDGILWYLFSLLGETDRRCVEIGTGSGMEANTTNLILNHGWRGLLVDGDEAHVQRGVEYFRKHKGCRIYPPEFRRAFVTRDNVNDLLREAGFEGELDLFSLDVDGVDYWLWEAIEVIQPRVVVTEYQDILGPDHSWTVPYQEDFDARRHSRTQGMPNYAGASLRAFASLARRKGYRLVGTNRYQYNAFWVRAGLGEDLLPEVPIADCFTHPKVAWGIQHRFPLVKDMPWTEIPE